MKTTPFTEKHIALGARMAEFAGFNMPISYSGINDEHQAVRKNAGIFDVSHMGEFILKGEQALDLIQRVTTNDASKLNKGIAFVHKLFQVAFQIQFADQLSNHIPRTFEIHHINHDGTVVYRLEVHFMFKMNKVSFYLLLH